MWDNHAVIERAARVVLSPIQEPHIYQSNADDLPQGFLDEELQALKASLCQDFIAWEFHFLREGEARPFFAPPKQKKEFMVCLDVRREGLAFNLRGTGKSGVFYLPVKSASPLHAPVPANALVRIFNVLDIEREFCAIYGLHSRDDIRDFAEAIEKAKAARPSARPHGPSLQQAE